MLEVKKRINKLQILISNSWMDFLFVCFVFSLPLRLRSAMLASKITFDRSNSDRDIQRPQDYFLTIFNRSSQTFDGSKMLYFEFLLRKFDNLTFHFMKQYSLNSNIIITTYPCIYLYIQQDQPT